MTGFRLLETMRLRGPGDVYLLHRHLSRLEDSARFFSFECDSEALQAAVVDLSLRHPEPSRLRALLSPNGEFELDVGPLPSVNPERLRISPARVHSENPFLYHKTTDREMYGTDIGVILVNERGEITETPIANIAVLRGGVWITPRVSCGLLPGVLRAELLDNGELAEDSIAAQDLVPGETVRCFNALRGVFDAVFQL